MYVNIKIMDKKKRSTFFYWSYHLFFFNISIIRGSAWALKRSQTRIVSLRLAPSAVTNFPGINSTLAICGHDKERGFLVTDHV